MKGMECLVADLEYVGSSIPVNHVPLKYDKDTGIVLSLRE